MTDQQTEQYDVIKSFLKRAAELESLLLRYTNSENYMQSQINIVKKQIGDTQVFSYGDTLPYRPDAKFSQLEPPKKEKPKNVFFHILGGIIETFSAPAVYVLLISTVVATLFFSFIQEDIIKGEIFKIIQTVFYTIISPIVGPLAGEGTVLIFIKLAIIVIILSIIILTIKSFKNEKAYFENIKRVDKTYKKAVAERNELLVKDREYLNFLTETLENIIEMKDRVKDSLKEHYARAIVFEKYRNFVAITQIHEYFESGRCYTLTGTTGAYNMFETEMRANIIIVQLQDISSKLNEIKKVQHMIYNAVQESNNLLKNIEDKLVRIQRDMNFNSTLTINALNDLKNEASRTIAYK